MPWIKGDDANRTKVVCSQEDKDQASVNSPSPSAEVTHSQIGEKRIERNMERNSQKLTIYHYYDFTAQQLYFFGIMRKVI